MSIVYLSSHFTHQITKGCIVNSMQNDSNSNLVTNGFRGLFYAPQDQRESNEVILVMGKEGSHLRSKFLKCCTAERKTSAKIDE